MRIIINIYQIIESLNRFEKLAGSGVCDRK